MKVDSKDSPRIKVTKDGPYIVTGIVPLAEEHVVIGRDGEPEKWEKGRSYPEKETYALCRCGASKTKPFCDGSHSRVPFDGTETARRGAYLENVEKTAGPGVDLTWSEDFCISARFCKGGKDAWAYAKRSNHAEARTRAIEEACNCPSGSLIAWDKITGAAIEPELKPEISLIENPHTGEAGPLWVKGGIRVESADGFEYETRNRVTLCGCGRSKNKPFCDGSHKKDAPKSKP